MKEKFSGSTAAPDFTTHSSNMEDDENGEKARSRSFCAFSP